MKQAITLFILLIGFIKLWSQKPALPEPVPLYFSSSGKESVNHVIQDKKGNYVLVGTDNNWFIANDENVFLKSVSSSAKEPPLNIVPIGKKGNQKAQCVVQTRDGGFVIAGSTDSTNENKQPEAWVIKVTELGNPIWNTIIRPEDASAASHSEFTAIQEDIQGNLWLTGESQGNLWVVKLNAKGEKSIVKMYDNTANAKSIKGNAMTWAADGKHLLIVGVQDMRSPANLQKLFYTRFNTERGVFYDDHIFPDNQMPDNPISWEGKDIVRDRTGHIAIVGTSYTGTLSKPLVMYATEQGDTLWTQQFGDKYLKGICNSIAEDWDGTFYIVGESLKNRGTNTKDAFIHKIDNNGRFLWEKPLPMGGNGKWGSNGNDVFNAIITSERGDIVAVGKHYKGTSTNGWMLTIPPSVLLQNKGRFDLYLSQGRFQDEEGNDILRPKKRAFYGFWLENKDSIDVFGLKASIKQTKPAQLSPHLSFYKEVVIGTLRANERRYITIPFESNQDLTNGEYDFDIQFAEFRKDLDLTHSFHVTTRENPQYKIEFSHNFPKYFKKGEVIKFNVSIVNTGDLIAERVKFQIPEVPRTRLLVPKVVELGDINPNESKPIEISLMVEKDFDARTLYMPVFVGVGGVRYGDKYELTSHEFPPPPPLDLKTRLYWQTNRTIAQRGQDSIMNVFDYNVQIQAVVELNRAIDNREDVHVWVNNRDITRNAKMDNVELRSLANDGVKSIYPFRYVIVADITMRDAETLVQVEVKDNKEQIKTPQLILRQTARPNLHILTVGVGYEGNNRINRLYHTQKDAKSIDSSFATLKGIFFNKITNTILLSPTETKARTIKEEIAEMAQNKDSNDITVIFLSGHGSVSGDGNLIFMGNDYDRTKAETFLNYKQHVEEPLRQIKGQKLVFIDACQSPLIAAGKRADNMADPQQVSEAWDKWVTAAPAYRALLSCSKGEYSYEFSEIGHGAFTYAILEAFRNQEVPCQGFGEVKCQANRITNGKNPDHILTFSELVEFVKKRVPYLSSHLPNGGDQHPTERVDRENEGKDIPVFWYDSQ